MSRPGIPEQQKRDEGAFLSAAYQEAKTADPSLTQDELMAERGLTQGLFVQWCNGSTPIPDKHLLWLGARLGFDAVKLRPSLAHYLWPTRLQKGRFTTFQKILNYCENAPEQEFWQFVAVFEAFVGSSESPTRLGEAARHPRSASSEEFVKPLPDRR